MATTTSSNYALPTFEAAFDQFKEQGEQLVDTQQKWLGRVIETQAEFARELTESYTSAVRSLLK